MDVTLSKQKIRSTLHIDAYILMTFSWGFVCEEPYGAHNSEILSAKVLRRS